MSGVLNDLCVWRGLYKLTGRILTQHLKYIFLPTGPWPWWQTLFYRLWEGSQRREPPTWSLRNVSAWRQGVNQIKVMPLDLIFYVDPIWRNPQTSLVLFSEYTGIWAASFPKSIGPLKNVWNVIFFVLIKYSTNVFIHTLTESVNINV